MAVRRLFMKVEGRVQGVGFRYFVQDHARRLSLKGWVRNERDGSVTIEAEGDEHALHQLEEFLSKGPPGARVAGISKEWGEASGTFRGFVVTH